MPVSSALAKLLCYIVFSGLSCASVIVTNRSRYAHILSSLNNDYFTHTKQTGLSITWHCSQLRRIMFLSVGLIFSSDSWSADRISPNGVEYAGITLFPELTVIQGWDNNLLRQTDNGIETFYTLLKPSVDVRAGSGSQQYKLGYRLDTGWYEASDNDNYLDHFLYGQALWSMDHRNAIGLALDYAATHEDRGTGVSQGSRANDFDDVVEFNESDIQLNYTLGSDESAGRLRFSLGWLAKDYTNFSSITRQRDRETFTSRINFLWRLGRTGIVFVAEHKDINYTNDPVKTEGQPDRLDSQQLKLLAGLRWDLTGKTSGNIKLGSVNRNFDDKDREKFSEISWEAEVNWLPVSYSKFIASFARTEQESDAEGSFIDSQNVTVRWLHEWSNDLSSKTRFSIIEDDYIDDPNQRKDDRLLAAAELNYQLNYWLQIGLAATWLDKDSTIDGLDFTRFGSALKLFAQL